MARGLVTVGHRSEFGAFGAAARFGDRTSRMEGATAWGMDGRGDIPGQEDAIAFGGRVHRGHGGQQDLGVGMLRVAANGVSRTGFHHATEVHDHDALAEVFDDGEIVRDEQVREPAVALDVLKQIDDLGLDAHVEGTDRLVTNDKPWLDGEGAGDADALPLASAELVGESVRDVGSETDALQEFGDTGLPGGLRIPQPMDDQCFADALSHRHPRIQRMERVLENHLELSPERAEGTGSQGRDILAVEEDPAAGGFQQS
jgi:hypothetical protein